MKMQTLFVAAGSAALVLAAGQASAQDWQGPYVGGFAGYGMLATEEDETVRFDTNLDGTYGDTVRTGAGADAFSPGFCDGSPNANNAGAGCEDDKDDGGELGGRIGYDFQAGSFVFGVVGDLGLAEGEDSVTAFSVTPANYSFERRLDYLAAARVRLGVATGRFLPYVTGGYASGSVISTFSSSNTANSFTPAETTDTAEGYQLGGGIETKVASNVSVGVEYMYTDLDVDSHIVRTGPGTAPATNPFLLVNPLGTDFDRTSDSFQRHSFRLTAALRF